MMNQCQRVDALDRFIDDVRTGRAFAFAWRSHASRRVGGPPITSRSWAECLMWLARLAACGDSYAQLVRAIGAPPLYGTDGEAAAAVWAAAHAALQRPYDDVIGRSGPDGGGRPSSYVRDWSLVERIVVLAHLKRATHAWSATAPGYGWALEQLAADEGVVLPSWGVRGAA